MLKKVEGLEGWRAEWLNGQMVRWLDGSLFKWLDGWMVEVRLSISAKTSISAFWG